MHVLSLPCNCQETPCASSHTLTCIAPFIASGFATFLTHTATFRARYFINHALIIVSRYLWPITDTMHTDDTAAWSWVHPLFNRASADRILQSPDGTLFRVHRVLLAQASDSPWWKRCLLDQAVIQVTEDESILAALLSLVYPLPDPALDTLDTVLPLICAAEKYGLREARTVLRGVLAPLAAAHPGRALALAWHHQDAAAVRLAARCFVRYCPYGDLELSLPAHARAAVVAYEAACAAAVAPLASCSPPWIPLDAKSMSRDPPRPLHLCTWEETYTGPVAWLCASCRGTRKVAFARVEPLCVAGWFALYMDAAGAALARWPSGEAVRSVDVLQAPRAAMMRCKRRPEACSSVQGRRDLDIFVEYFARRVEDAVDQVNPCDRGGAARQTDLGIYRSRWWSILWIASRSYRRHDPPMPPMCLLRCEQCHTSRLSCRPVLFPTGTCMTI
jgi:hypothetical protein